MENNFINFLIKAKLNTYANGLAKRIKLEDGSKQLIFEEGDFKYVDRYYGFDSFIGEEIVFEKGKFIWGMNYYGKIISKVVSGKKIYKFLKKVMGKISEENPFRGPRNFKEKGFEYVNESIGDTICFKGKEKILYDCEEVYNLEYFGGVIKK